MYWSIYFITKIRLLYAFLFVASGDSIKFIITVCFKFEAITSFYIFVYTHAKLLILKKLYVHFNINNSNVVYAEVFISSNIWYCQVSNENSVKYVGKLPLLW